MARFVILVFVFAVLAIIVTSIISYGGVNNFMSAVGLQLYGQLTIGNDPPTIVGVFLDSDQSPAFSGLRCAGDDQECTTTPGVCSADPLSGEYCNPLFRVRVSDTNGDCDQGTFNVYVTYCLDALGNLDCDPLEPDVRGGEVTLVYDPGSMSGTECDYEWPSGLGTGSQMDFWEDSENNYEVYIRVNDGAAPDVTTVVYWEYNSLNAIKYPEGDTNTIVDYGALTLGSMQEGRGDSDITDTTGDLIMMNSGNAQSCLEWRARDFCTGGSCPASGTYIDIDDSSAEICDYPNYILDDDALYSEGVETGRGEVSFPDTTDNVNFPASYVDFPSLTDTPSYLDVCGSHACPSGSYPNAKFNVYYHICVPVGQTGGTYRNGIEVAVPGTPPC